MCCLGIHLSKQDLVAPELFGQVFWRPVAAVIGGNGS